jgi:polyhydroxybutyrate depolymerase
LNHMKKKRTMMIGIVLALVAIGSGMFFYWVYAPAAPEPVLLSTARCEVLQVGSLSRTYLSYVPPMDERHGPVPLVIVFHGSRIDGSKIREWTAFEFDQMADKSHFVVAYPDGVDHGWNDLSNTRATTAKKKGIDDIGFIQALIEKQRQLHHIDPQRVYAFGYSNGGAMIFRVLAQQPGLFAAAATVAAALPTAESSLLTVPLPQTVPPILLVNGTADPIIPYEGGRIKFFGQKRGGVMSARQTAESFAATHGATQTPASRLLPHTYAHDPTTVEEQIWRKDGKQVVALYTVRQGGHVVPQPVAKFPRFLGPVSLDLNAPRAALKFFGLLDNHE